MRAKCVFFLFIIVFLLSCSDSGPPESPIQEICVVATCNPEISGNYVVWSGFYNSENDLYYPGIFVWDGVTAIQVSEGYDFHFDPHISVIE